MPRKITSKQQYLYSAAQKDLNGGYSIMMLRDSERELLAEVWKFAGFGSPPSLPGCRIAGILFTSRCVTTVRSQRLNAARQ